MMLRMGILAEYLSAREELQVCGRAGCCVQEAGIHGVEEHSISRSD
jgi:hypothetical protein